MRVVLFGGHRNGHEWHVAGPLDIPDGDQEYAHRIRIDGIPSGSTGDGWGPLPTWIYVLTDEVKTIGGETVRVMRQDRMAPPRTLPPPEMESRRTETARHAPVEVPIARWQSESSKRVLVDPSDPTQHVVRGRRKTR